MNTVRKVLVLVYLINTRYQLVRGTFSRSFDWLEDVDGTDRAYGPSLLTTTTLSMVTCLTRCSNTAKCKAATYNNGTGECNCLDRKTTSTTTQLGNRLWRRQFGGFVYNAHLEWHIGLFINIKKTQAEAESFCGTLEGRLAVLDTDEKLNYVTGLPDYQAYQSHYVGATYEQTENVFLWTNGATLTTNWGPNQPNKYRDKNCVVLYHATFFDNSCTYLLDCACEIE